MEMEEAVAVKRAVSKSSRMYSNSSWDFPKELKGKSESEITSYIEQKKSERTKIQKEIQELNRKREAYISKNQKDDAKGELENAMLEAIQRQAKKKNYSWD